MRNLLCKLCLQGLSEINCVWAQVLGGFGANIRNNNYKFRVHAENQQTKIGEWQFRRRKMQICANVTSQ